MKKFYEGIKDILYDSIDYIIIIGIIGVVVLVISWRLDLLFANDALGIPNNNDIVVHDIRKPEDDANITEGNEGDVDEKPSLDDEDMEDKDNNQIQEPVPGIVVTIIIPEGTLPSKIGSILEENQLISSRTEFVQKSQDMKLDTKLKSGKYEIEIGSSLEEILELIAK